MADGSGFGVCQCGSNGGGGGGGGINVGGGGGPAGGGQPSVPVDFQLIALSDWNGQLESVDVPTDLGDGGLTAAATGGASTLSAFLAIHRAENPNTLVVTQGNEFGRSPMLSTLFDDEPAVRALTLMGLQGSTLGEHQFDHGTARLNQLLALTTWPVVSTNLEQISGTLTGVTAPWTIVDVGGVKVALIGITNPELEQATRDGVTGTITAPDLATSVSRAQAALSEANAAGAKVAVALVNLSAGTKDGVTRGPLIDFANATHGFSVIFGGGTAVIAGFDPVVDTVANFQRVMTSGRGGRSYVRLTLSVNVNSFYPGEVPQVRSAALEFPRTTFRFPDGGTLRDPAVDELIRSFAAQLPSKLDQPVAKSTSVFAGNSMAERTQETALGDLVTDAWRERYGVQLALANSGGLRASLPSSAVVGDAGFPVVRTGCSTVTPCDLVRADPYAVLPFDHSLVTRTITGAQLWSAMQWGLGSLPAPSDRFPQISGFHVSYVASDAGARVQAITLDDGGFILVNNVRYSLVTNEFIAGGGDGYDMFLDGQGQRFREGAAEVLEAYLRDAGTVSAGVGGRIVAQ